MRSVTGAARIFTRRCNKKSNFNNCSPKTTGKTINGTSTRPKSTAFHRPIGCHVSSFLGHNSTTSLLSLAEPSMVTSSLDCDDEDDIDGT